MVRAKNHHGWFWELRRRLASFLYGLLQSFCRLKLPKVGGREVGCIGNRRRRRLQPQFESPEHNLVHGRRAAPPVAAVCTLRIQKVVIEP